MLSWLKNLTNPTKKLTYSENTFIIWEPCTHSHAEVIPGYARYLLDLGFEVAIFATPARFDEGLFSKFNDSRIQLHRLPQWKIRRHFNKNGLGAARGILITTARKLSGQENYELESSIFSQRTPNQKLLLVDHDIKATHKNGTLSSQIITLRQPHYKNAITTVVNPHYFGEFPKSVLRKDAVNFITIGAMRKKRRNTTLLINAAEALHRQGIFKFKITVIGKGSLAGIPSHLKLYFDIKGRIDFSQLYSELENADFFLTLLDPENPEHNRYITTGTSGSFQLIYGFLRPCLIAKKFAEINQFTPNNSIIYNSNDELAEAMKKAISLSHEDYEALQKSLQMTADAIYKQSLANLSGLINN